MTVPGSQKILHATVAARLFFARDRYVNQRLLRPDGPLQTLRKRVQTNSKFPNLSYPSLNHIVMRHVERAGCTEKRSLNPLHTSAKPSWGSVRTTQGEGARLICRLRGAGEANRKQISKSKGRCRPPKGISGFAVTIHGPAR